VIRRWLSNLFWLPRWLYLRMQVHFLRRDLVRLQAEQAELRKQLEAKK